MANEIYKVKGHLTPGGYIAYIPEIKKWVEFETEQAYEEFMNEIVERLEHDLLYGKEAT